MIQRLPSSLHLDFYPQPKWINARYVDLIYVNIKHLLFIFYFQESYI